MNTNWYYEINTLKTEELFDNTASITENKQLINKNYEAAGKNIVKVYKKSTGADQRYFPGGFNLSNT